MLRGFKWLRRGTSSRLYWYGKKHWGSIKDGTLLTSWATTGLSRRTLLDSSLFSGSGKTKTHLPVQKKPLCTYCIESWMGPKARLNGMVISGRDSYWTPPEYKYRVYIWNATIQQSRTEIQKNKPEAGPPHVGDSSNFPRDTWIKVTLTARPPLTPVAEIVRSCKHGVFTRKTCVHSRLLLHSETVYWCS
jgi:hypothetical protein